MRKHSGAFSLKKGYILTVLGVVLTIVILVIAYKLIRDWEFSKGLTTQVSQPNGTLADDSDIEERPMIYYNDGWYELRDHIETVLLLGIDKYEEDLSDKKVYRNTQQTDFIMLLVINKEENTYSAIHLNRDTMTKVPTLSIDGKFAGYVNEQITLAHTYGSGGADSCKNTVRAVSEFLYGMNVDHYIALTMDAVAMLNDAVGGVTITLEDDFSSVDPTMSAGDTITLQGSQALTYVRARGSMEDSSNLSRMRRQQAYLNALYKEMQAKAEADSGFMMKTLLGINDYMTSDCSIQQLNDIAEATKSSEFLGIENTPGEAVVGEEFMEFYVDEDGLSDMIVKLFYKPTKIKLFS